VLCVLIDVKDHRLTVASAGHIPPLLLDGDHARFVEFEVNVPIGVSRSSPFREATLPVAPNSALIAFTDGLVERRGEPLDAGLARLRNAAIGQKLTLEQLLAKLAEDLASDYHHDDTALVGIQWQN